MKISVLHHASFVLLLAGSFAIGAEPTTVKLPAVLGLLRHEAKKLETTDRANWPYPNGDFAAGRGWTMDSEDLQRALSTQLHKNPGIDSWMKRQLLSFSPGLLAFDAAGFDDVVQAGADPLVRPVLNRKAAMDRLQNPDASSGAARYLHPGTVHVQQFAEPFSGLGRFEVIRSCNITGAPLAYGFVPNRQQSRYALPYAGRPYRNSLESARYINRHLNIATEQVAWANGLIFDYHDALIEKVPEGNGQRLALMVHDLRQRIEAGDVSADAAFERLMQATADTDAVAAMPRYLRYAVSDELRSFDALQRWVIEKVEANRDGTLEFSGRNAGPSPEQLETLIKRFEREVSAPEGDDVPQLSTR